MLNRGGVLSLDSTLTTWTRLSRLRCHQIHSEADVMKGRNSALMWWVSAEVRCDETPFNPERNLWLQMLWCTDTNQKLHQTFINQKAPCWQMFKGNVYVRYTALSLEWPTLCGLCNRTLKPRIVLTRHQRGTWKDTTTLKLPQAPTLTPTTYGLDSQIKHTDK